MKNDFNFDVSISYKNYQDKPTYYGSMLFRKENVTTNQLLCFIKDGYSFMAELKDYQVKQIDNRLHQGRTQNDIKQTNFIGVDVDDSEIGFSDYISTISFKPTFAYTTPNDGIKGNRFRLVYIVNEPIKEQSEFATYYNGIISTLNNQTNTINNDDCGAKIERLFNGNGKETIKTYESGLIYSKNDLPKGDIITHISTKQATKARKSKKANTNVEKDFFNMDFDEFYSKYTMKRFIPIMESKVDFKGKLYATLDEDFIEIKRFNKRGVLSRENNKLGIGEGRKKYLWKVLQLKRKIKPTITSDELLFNAVFEVYNFIDNEDGKLSKSYIMECVENVMNSECTINTTNTKKIRVNKKLCDDMGISAKAVANKARGERNHAKIGEWYDVSLSVGKNLKFAKNSNIKISRRTLYNFCNENGINPKGEPMEEPTNKAEISAHKSDIKQGGTTHQTQQETPLKRNYEPIKWVNADEYRERCKLYQLFAERNQKIMSYKMAI